LRPGEKLYEELLTDCEVDVVTQHPKLRISRARAVDARFLAQLDALMRRRDTSFGEDLRGHMLRWIPEYRPEGKWAPDEEAGHRLHEPLDVVDASSVIRVSQSGMPSLRQEG
ncbi:MAG: hypothetical protein JSW48_02980, partial [Betaproteobacteria bacterium]